MNASPKTSPLSSPLPARDGLSGAPLEEKSQAGLKRRAGRSWVVSITGVCFLFGGLLAAQLRTIQEVQSNRERERAGVAQAALLAEENRQIAARATRERDEATRQLNTLRSQLTQSGSLNAQEVQALNAQIRDLEAVAGLTPVTGPGLRLVLSDSPAAPQASSEGSFWPGLVHDFDVLQVVNELRAAKAEAVAVKGVGGDAIRVTGYTPIRCVGPVIYINWEPVAGPYTIEAIGDTRTLRSALEMPGGIIDNLKNNGTIGVEISEVPEMSLPKAGGGAPKMRVARVGDEA